MPVLAIDASASVGTVAVMRGGTVMAEAQVAMRGEHEERLMPAVAEVLAGAALTVRDLDAVACGAGPGGFTGLRIAAAIAKGIAHARGIPLYARSSLFLIAAGNADRLRPGTYLAALDAMRGERFATQLRLTESGCIVHDAPTVLISADILAAQSLPGGGGPTTIGPGCEIDVLPHARGFALDPGWWSREPPVSLGAWEPTYGRRAEAQVRWESTHGRSLSGA